MLQIPIYCPGKLGKDIKCSNIVCLASLEDYTICGLGLYLDKKIVFMKANPVLLTAQILCKKYYRLPRNPAFPLLMIQWICLVDIILCSIWKLHDRSYKLLPQIKCQAIWSKQINILLNLWMDSFCGFWSSSSESTGRESTLRISA